MDPGCSDTLGRSVGTLGGNQFEEGVTSSRTDETLVVNGPASG